MRMTDYKTAALRTASPNFHGDNFDRNIFSASVGKALNAAAELDVAKKGLYYGKTVPKKSLPVEGSPGWDDLDKDLLHAALGLVTEAAEFMEKVLKGGEDRAALISELGDVLWYANIATRPLETNLGQVAALNIDKLEKRYPEKFTLDNAVNKSAEDEDAMIAEKLEAKPWYITYDGRYLVMNSGSKTWVDSKDEATKFFDQKSAADLAHVMFPGISVGVE